MYPTLRRYYGGDPKRFGATHDLTSGTRLDDEVRRVFSVLHKCKEEELCVSLDALCILGKDAKWAPKTHHRGGEAVTEEEKKYFEFSGNSLDAHVDVCMTNEKTLGRTINARLQNRNQGINECIQGHLVVSDVPEGGATFVFAHGMHKPGMYDANDFQPSNGDFSKLNDTGLKKCFGYWRYIDNVPAGSLILWPSSLPHGNKSANKTCQEKGRYGLYICYLPKEIETTDERSHTERQKRRLLMVAIHIHTGLFTSGSPVIERGGVIIVIVEVTPQRCYTVVRIHQFSNTT